MRLTHINITIPRGTEREARAFYGDLLGLTEIPKPEPLRARGGLWFDAAGFDIHLSIEERRPEADVQRHFGLACDDIPALRSRLESASVPIDEGRPAPWRRFFIHDPFGNRIEIHEFESLDETAQLLRSPKNAQRLREAVEQLRAGEGTARELPPAGIPPT